MTIDFQVNEKCVCQTTSAIDEGVLKNVSAQSIEKKEKVTVDDQQSQLSYSMCDFSL